MSIVSSGDGIPAKVYATEPLGGETIVDLTLGDRVIKALAPSTIELKPGGVVAVRFDPRRLHLFDAAGDAVLSAGGADGVFSIAAV